MIRRAFWVSVATIIEMIKDKAVAGFFFVGVLLIMGGYIVAEMSVVEKSKMFIDSGVSAIFLVSIFITLLGGSNVIDREIREKEVLCTLSKPLSRFEWLIGKTFGFVFTLGLLILCLSVFLVLFVKLQTHIWYPLIFMGAILIFLEMVIISSYTILFSTITSQYLSLFFGVLVLFIGHMVDDLKIYWASQSFAASALTKILYYVIPSLQSFQAAPVSHGQTALSLSLIAAMTLYTFAYLVVCISIAVAVINNKEMA